jgi:hypothetical protein
MAGREGAPKEGPLAREAPRALTPGDEAAREALASLNYGEAPQVGVLGDTGCGKTIAMNAIVALYLKMSPGWVLVVDDKELRPRYEGQQRRDVADLVARPHDPNGSRVIVFRGVPSQGIDADPEEVAELAWKRAARGRKSLVVHDELVAGRTAFIKSRQWRKGVEYMPKSFTKGRSPGVGDLWGAQSPQEVPLDPFEQSHMILCFRLAGLGLEALASRDYLLGGAEAVIPKLPGPPMPPDQRGVFVALRRGLPWNGKFYKFGAPPANDNGVRRAA